MHMCYRRPGAGAGHLGLSEAHTSQWDTHVTRLLQTLCHMSLSRSLLLHPDLAGASASLYKIKLKYSEANVDVEPEFW